MKLVILECFENAIDVTPFAGVWIEIISVHIISYKFSVTPFAGVWIEITVFGCLTYCITSLPSRECGLKCQKFPD